MIYEELKLPFPIYNNINKQDRFLKKNDVTNTPLISFIDSPLPFQFRLHQTGASITSWQVMSTDGSVALNLSGSIGSIETGSVEGYTYFTYKGMSLGITLAPGFYYLQFVVNGASYFSEVFFVPCDAPYWGDNGVYTKVEWDNNGCNLGPILYTTGYKNIWLTASTLEKLEPTIEEEGYEDGLKNFFPTSQVYIDNLSITDLVPLYLSEALVLMAIHKKVLIQFPGQLYTGSVRNIKPTAELQDNTNLYRFSAKFQQITHYYSSACCGDQLVIPEGSLGIYSDIYE